MDTRRRRLLRHKYLEEEERLGKMSRGLSYDDDDENEDFNTDDNEKVNRGSASRVPKYKARTFKNILRDFDDPDFDESQNYGQKYQREEIEQEEPQEPQKLKEPKDAVAPRHLTVRAERKRTSLRHIKPEELYKPKSEEAPQEEKINDDEKILEKEFVVSQDKTEEAEVKFKESDYLDDYEPGTDEAETAIAHDQDEDDMEAPLPPDYQPQPIRRKKTLRQMEAEDRRRHTGKSRPQAKVTSPDSKVEVKKTGASNIFRFFAFIAFVMLAFLCGYFVCGVVLKVMNVQPGGNIQEEQRIDEAASFGQKGLNKIEKQATSNQAASTAPKSGDVKSCTIFIPKSGALDPVNVELKSVTSSEQMLKSVLNTYIDGVKEAGLLSTSTELTELWIAGDTVYLSLNQNFVSDLHRLNTANATLLMRGFLRSINANMSSVKKLKVFADSQEITGTRPIDLTRLWETM